ncbi:hypothetical protein HK103_000222 [Boothiomyces macroporosus]|uniref:Uncharacterized protein n=1 Tax=Boothiomyces macroporosus TaxID=261099 RepID=A0AAD5UKJ4_9FUNG|nr:hypothetical protein HK103_000222 [Boothiomyces macroporosus]
MQSFKKKLFATRADGSDSSEGEIIIDISDNDTVSTLESETEEEQEVKIEPEPPVLEKKTIKLQKKDSRVKKSWADDPIESRGREKRHSEVFNRRSNDNATTSSKWAHDLFNEDDSDDDQERVRSFKRSNKGRKKDKSRKAAPSEAIKEKDSSKRAIDNRSVPDQDLPPIKQLNIEEKKEEIVEQPKVRRVLSQASKNQLLASISRPEARPIDRSVNEPKLDKEKSKEKQMETRHEKNEEKTDRVDRERYENIRLERNGERERNDLARQERNGERAEQLRLERNEHLKSEREKEYSERKDRSRDRSERYDRKEKERYDRNQKSSEVTLVDRNSNRSPKLDKQPKYEREVVVHEKIVVEKRAKTNLKRNSTSSQANDHTSNASIEKSDNPEELQDQIVSTASGWAIYNPSPKIELDMKKDVKSKSYDSNRKKRPATFQPPQQLINVQPMITQSGQMVLLTETGLMVPATPDMFQSYQQQYMYPPPPPEQTPYAYSYPSYYPGDGAAPNPEVSKKIS